MRERWKRWQPIQGIDCLICYLEVFCLQGLFSMVVNASAIHVIRTADASDKIGAWEIAGAVVWVIGFVFEVVADYQLQAHRDDPSKKGTIITTGVWRYSRHPNYFGEALLWWGVYLVACGQRGGVWTFYSALIITILVRWVSGARLLEKK